MQHPRHLVFAVLLGAMLLGAGMPTEAKPAPSSHRMSYWGPLPAPSDSTVARPVTPRPAVWELPLEGAWWVAKAPFELVKLGAREGLYALDDTGALRWLGKIFSGVDLPYGVTPNFVIDEVTGTGGGLTFYHNHFLGPDSRFRLKTRVTTRGNQLYSGGMVVPVGAGAEFEWGGGYRQRTGARFFGIGPHADDEAESYFTQELTWGGATYRQELGSPQLSARVGALYSIFSSRGPREPEEYLPLALAFAGDLPPGYGRRSEGWSFGLSLARDTTDDTGRPQGCSVQRVSLSFFEPRESDEASFFTYRAETQHFLRLWRDRVLALRVWGSWIDAERDGDVHFQRLMTNDDPDLLRGYIDFRWRDRGMAALDLEYRWWSWEHSGPGSTGLDAYLFYDTGQVFGSAQELALENLTHSYGLGLRLATPRGFGGRVELAWSEEGFVFRLRGDQLFQYARRGLYHGREPIPIR